MSRKEDLVNQLQHLEKEIEALKSIVSQLRQEVAGLRQESQRGAIETLLRQRGFPILSCDDRSQLLIPSELSPQQADQFYQLMRRYSFRLFLRDLIQYPQGTDYRTLNRYCSARTVRSYMKQLAELGIVHIDPNRNYRLIPHHAISFGPTLEWFVSEIFKREFSAPALFNVRLRKTLYGGDYDVVAFLTGCLVYVEVKSSPPRGVELQAVSAFLKRVNELQPHMAVFLVDTELRMADKIVPLFEEAIRETHRAHDEWPVLRLVNEIFHIRHSIYLINSKKGVYSNLRHCFRDFLSHEKRAEMFPGNAGAANGRPVKPSTEE